MYKNYNNKKLRQIKYIFKKNKKYKISKINQRQKMKTLIKCSNNKNNKKCKIEVFLFKI